MLRILIFFTILFSSMNAKTQSNLQISRIITFSGTLSNSEEKILDTVPNGKAWKIEAIGISGNEKILKINGKSYVNFTYAQNGSYASSQSSIHETIWLKQGDILSYWHPYNSNCCQGSGCCPVDYFVSILEFNLL